MERPTLISNVPVLCFNDFISARSLPSLPALEREGTELTAERTTGKTRRPLGKVKVSGKRFPPSVGNSIPPFLLPLPPIRHWKCPAVSWARAGPSRPGRCWSTTRRSYLMIIAPPLEALYSLPLPEVRAAPSTLLRLNKKRRLANFLYRVCCHQTMSWCHCGLGSLVIPFKTKTKLSPAPIVWSS